MLKEIGERVALHDVVETSALLDDADLDNVLALANQLLKIADNRSKAARGAPHSQPEPPRIVATPTLLQKGTQRGTRATCLAIICAEHLETFWLTEGGVGAGYEDMFDHFGGVRQTRGARRA